MLMPGVFGENSHFTLKVMKRDMSVKAKKLRKDGFVTGNIAGKEIEGGSMSIIIPVKDAEKVRHDFVKGSQLYLELDGKTYDVLLKEVEYNAQAREIMEMDFQAMVQGEKVHSTAEIILLNRDSIAGGIVEQLLSEVSYKALPEDITDKIEIDCSKLKTGDVIKVSDLDIAKNEKIDLITHADQLVVSVALPHYKAEEAAAPAAEEAPADKKAAPAAAKK